MAEENKDSKSKLIIIVLIIVIVLLVVGIGAGAIFFLNSGKNQDTPAVTTALSDSAEPAGSSNPLILDYDAAAVALDEDSLSKAVEELREKAQSGYVNLKFKNLATSDDGIHFQCYLGNSDGNIYDMFFNIYKDATLSEQIYLSGLVSPGNVIESFDSEIKLDPGEYSAIIMFTSVSDDHTTMISQVPVEITLVVNSNQ
jgi:ABC-type Na+ efflux pump permease subunit